MKRLILGLEPNETKMYMVPETLAWNPATRDPRVRWLRRQLYHLSFELLHGQIFRSAPPYTRFFIAVPDPKSTIGALGNEESVFREYLRERLRWTDAMIDQRVRFFQVSAAVPFPQDMTEPLGYDDQDRLVLGLGGIGDDVYTRAVERLAQSSPNDFVLRLLPGVNTEGGDLALVRVPEGGIGLLLGHNRIRRLAEQAHPGLAPDAPIPTSWIEDARRAYAKAFSGVETIIVGEEALRDPKLNNPEIFHLDMVAAVIRGRSGAVTAFVPTYQGNPVDALSHVHLSEESVRRFQAEYDRAAEQLRRRGYPVVRVPYADHPARSPVGIGKFVDAVTGRPSVLLGRYPDHLRDSDDRNVQTQLQLRFETLDEAVEAWRRDPSDARWEALRAAVAACWRQMDAAQEAPNPLYEEQKRLYEAAGIDVAPLPIFPTGEGGVHCLVLK